MKKVLITLMAVVFGTHAFSQVEVEVVTPEEAVGILTGLGVQPFNISYTGDPSQLGLLTGADGTLFPIAEGIVLSSSNATALGCEGETALAGVSGEPDLLTVANSVPPLINQSFSVSAVNDVAILEFDFVASGNELEFSYTFGSDEYTTWVNTQYNDVFAFFLSGPGILGEFDAPAEFPGGAINLAVLPDSDPELPITISSVNNVLNSDLYINNTGSDVCTNAFTTELTVYSEVLCGETYHIKLAIADGSDNALASYVTLEAGSFASNGLFIDGNASVSGTIELDNDTILVEGCSDAVFTLFRPDATEAQTINYEISGAATAGDDYTALSGSVNFAVDQTTFDIPVETFDDGIAEPLEDLTLSYTFINICGDTVTSVATLWIADHIFPELATEDVNLYCGNAYVTADVLAGYQPLEWQWGIVGEEPYATTEGIIVNTTNDYYAIATDLCGATDSVSVSVFDNGDEPPAIVLDNNMFSVDCPGDFLTIEPQISGGAPNFFYVWSGPGFAGWQEETYTSSFNETVTLSLTVADQCQQIEEFDIIVDVPTYVPIVITADDASSPCAGVEVGLNATAENGFAPLEFFWGSNGSGQSIQVSPDVTTTYEVTVQDNCGNEESEDVVVTVGEAPEFEWDVLEPQCTNLEQAVVVSGGIAPYSYSYDDTQLNVIGNSVIGLQPGIFILDVVDNCGNVLPLPVTVVGCDTPVPNVFTPGNKDDFNDTFFIEGLDSFPNSKLSVFNRWGSLVYENSNYLNKWDGDDLPEATYYYVLERSDGESLSGYFQIMRE